MTMASKWFKSIPTRYKVPLATLAWAPVFVFFFDHVYSVATITGQSMQPTFNPDSSKLRRDVVLLNRWQKAFGGLAKLKIGDVVTLFSPQYPRLLTTKRIIALEGDIVTTCPPYPAKYVKVPTGHAWVEGDESFHSRDSNTYGPIPLGLIDGKVEWIIWPWRRFGPVSAEALYAKEKRVRRSRDQRSS